MPPVVLTPVDYAILAAGAVGAAAGLFIGFSGALAFLAGGIVSAVCACLGWGRLAELVTTPWLRSLTLLLMTLLVFGIVRTFVRRFVHVMIAQPGDALFGAIASAAFMLLLGLGAAWLGDVLNVLPYPSGLLPEVRRLLPEVLRHVG